MKRETQTGVDIRFREIKSRNGRRLRSLEFGACETKKTGLDWERLSEQLAHCPASQERALNQNSERRRQDSRKRSLRVRNICRAWRTPTRAKSESLLPHSPCTSHSIILYLLPPILPPRVPSSFSQFHAYPNALPSRQNNALLTSLSQKTSALKHITLDIYDNARNQSTLDNTNEVFSSMSTNIRGSAGRLTRMAKQGDRVAILKIAGCVVVGGLVVWWVGGWVLGLVFGR